MDHATWALTESVSPRPLALAPRRASRPRRTCELHEATGGATDATDTTAIERRAHRSQDDMLQAVMHLSELTAPAGRAGRPSGTVTW
jgi:hypothetical protein